MHRIKSYMVLIFGLISIISCNTVPADQQAKTGTIIQLNSDEFATELKKYTDPQLIDVRTAEEYTRRHLENAWNFNYYAAAFDHNIESANKNEPVFLYCSSGSRSAEAAIIFQQKGFKVIYDLKGGINAWQADGKPVVNSTATQ